MEQSPFYSRPSSGAGLSCFKVCCNLQVSVAGLRYARLAAWMGAAVVVAVFQF